MSFELGGAADLSAAVPRTAAPRVRRVGLVVDWRAAFVAKLAAPGAKSDRASGVAVFLPAMTPEEAEDSLSRAHRKRLSAIVPTVSMTASAEPLRLPPKVLVHQDCPEFGQRSRWVVERVEDGGAFVDRQREQRHIVV